jgi:hypothetical protein
MPPATGRLQHCDRPGSATRDREHDPLDGRTVPPYSARALFAESHVSPSIEELPQMRVSSFSMILGSLLVTATTLYAQTPSGSQDPRDTDPIKLGWMVGSPPPADKLINLRDGSSYRFPQWRWSFSHWRELVPTVEVSRGAAPVAELPSTARTISMP